MAFFQNFNHNRANRVSRVGRVGASVLMLALGCGPLTSKNSLTDPGTGTVANLGCIQGVVVNGLTGDPVDLTVQDSAVGTGLRVLVGPTTLEPAAVNADLADKADLAGHYSLCNVPLDETYPIQLTLPGYQKVEGQVRVDSTAPSQSPNAKTDLEKQVPTEIVNIAVFPVGAKTNDLKVQVSHDGQPVSGAAVILLPTGGNGLVDDQKFLIAAAISPAPMQQITGTDGTATFPAAALVLGAELHYRVLPPSPLLATLTVAEDDIYVGMVNPKDPNAALKLPYIVNVELKNQLPAFNIVPLSASTQEGDASNTGEVWLIFNRNIQIVPGTEDGIIASLDHVTGATLVADIPGNNKSEQVTWEIKKETPNKLHLTPNFKVKPDVVADGGMTVTFSGIHLRPTDSPGTGVSQELKLAPVPVFGGITPTQIPTRMVLNGAATLSSAPANSDETQALSVTVLDQFNNPFKGQLTVTFTLPNNGSATSPGTVRPVGADQSAGATTLAVQSDPTSGIAAATWHLGSVTGAQAVTITAGTFPPVNVAATALAVPSHLNQVSSTNLLAPTGQELPDVISLAVLDQNGAAMGAGVSVHFHAVAGYIRTPDGPRGTLTDLDVPTDIDGIASVRWTLGNDGSAAGVSQVLDGSLGGLAATVTATALQVVSQLVNLSPIPSQINITQFGTAYELTVQLRDDENNPYTRNDPQQVTFTVNGVGGVISADGATTGVGSTQSFTATVDQSTGQAHAKLWSVLAAPGTFTVTATSAGFQLPITTATVGDIAGSLAAVAGFPPTASLGQSIMYSVLVTDQAGQGLINTPVTFSVISSTVYTATGTLRAQLSDPVGQQTTMVARTDGQGHAAVVFNVATGASGAAFEVQATSTGLATALFDGKVQ